VGEALKRSAGDPEEEVRKEVAEALEAAARK
jgi:hypothetical protein